MSKKRLNPTTRVKESTATKFSVDIRLAGAQIPVTKDVSKNIIEIKQAIDYASEVEADFLVTPEGALSGYYPEFMDRQEQFQELISAEHEVVSYAREKNLGLCLGTLFLDNEDHGQLKRDQIRFYNKTGDFVAAYNKIQTIRNDNVVPGTFCDNTTGNVEGEDYWTGHPIVQLRKNANTAFEVSALICNDMYGENEKGESIARRALYQLRNSENPLEFIIHPTYGLRGDEVIDAVKHPKLGGGKYSEEYQNSIRTTMEDWHKTHLEMLSYQMNMSFFVVDACSDFSGNISKYKTSSPSGVVERGVYVTDVPRIGRQYFYHDFNVLSKVVPTDSATLHERLAAIRNSQPKE